MPQQTDHYQLEILGPNEPLSSDGYKFTDADRRTIDRLLYLGAEGHHHRGEASTDNAPNTAPGLTIDTTQGALPPGKRVYYEFTFISPEGIETAASPSAHIDMPPAIVAPGAATAVVATTGGTLAPGQYFYALSAYKTTDSQETPASVAVSVLVPAGTSTNKVTLTLPTLPGSADGFNVYRLAPSGGGYLHVATIDMTVMSPPTTFIDDGSLTEDCDRFAPTQNTTVTTNSVTVAIPGVSPALPGAGWTWRVYRTFNSADWTASLVATIVSGALTYLDLGTAASVGAPPSGSIGVGTPSRIQLTDSAEVQGRAAMSRISAFPHCETFSFPGALIAMNGTSTWVCPFPQATIAGVQACLGKGYEPDAQDVIVDVNMYDPSAMSPAWVSIFTGGSTHQPKVLVGHQVGASVVPNSITELKLGDLITIDIDQTGAGADTDRDLTVMLFLLVYGWTSDISHVWAP